MLFWNYLCSPSCVSPHLVNHIGHVNGFQTRLSPWYPAGLCYPSNESAFSQIARQSVLSLSWGLDYSMSWGLIEAFLLFVSSQEYPPLPDLLLIHCSFLINISPSHSFWGRVSQSSSDWSWIFLLQLFLLQYWNSKYLSNILSLSPL